MDSKGEGKKWFDARPEGVKEMCRRFPPGSYVVDTGCNSDTGEDTEYKLWVLGFHDESKEGDGLDPEQIGLIVSRINPNDDYNISRQVSVKIGACCVRKLKQTCEDCGEFKDPFEEDNPHE